VVICELADPEAKGIVERANGYLETSFLPGRTFASRLQRPARGVAPEGEHLPREAPRRTPGRTDRPRPRRDAHFAACGTGSRLAPEPAAACDHYVRLDANDHSVHPAAIGRRVQVSADLHQVKVHREGVLVACHERIWAGAQSITTRPTPRPQAAARADERAPAGAQPRGPDPRPG
jgi:hypothetical protein